MSKLFSPLTVRSVTFKNRIITSPMCMYMAEDGFASDWQLVHYGSRAMGGAGAVMLEATAVRADGRIGVGDLGIWKDEHIEMLTKITSFVKVPDLFLQFNWRMPEEKEVLGLQDVKAAR